MASCMCASAPSKPLSAPHVTPWKRHVSEQKYQTVRTTTSDPSNKQSYILLKKKLLKIILCCRSVTVGKHIAVF